MCTKLPDYESKTSVTDMHLMWAVKLVLVFLTDIIPALNRIILQLLCFVNLFLDSFVMNYQSLQIFLV